jgi:integrase/recombinase XerD
MTPLRQEFINEMTLRGFSPNTQAAYVRAVAGLAQFYHRSPSKLFDDEIKTYLLHLIRVRKLAASSIIVAVSALRFLYGQVLVRPIDELAKSLPTMKKPILRPRVYSVPELEKLFGLPNLNPKHRALFLTTYAAGLRVSEVCHLQIADLHSDRCQIRVVQGKNHKDRYTIFSPRLQEELRAYWRLYRPKEWLFPSPLRLDRPLTRSAVERAFTDAVERAGLPDRGGIHSLRHSFGTHLLEAGVDPVTLQRLMGHTRLATTTGYLHVSQAHLNKISSALDLIDFDRAKQTS